MKPLSSSRSGNVAIITALVLTGLAAMVGVGMEYSRISSAKSAFQNALDAALLATARMDDEDDATNSAFATQYLKQQLSEPYVSYPFTVTVKTEDGMMMGTLTSDVPGMFAGFTGRGDNTVTAKAAVQASVRSQLEVALVLDATGSMSGAKLDALKDAANELVETLMVAPNVRISVIPFAHYVKVPMSMRNHPGLSVPNDVAGELTCEMKEQFDHVNCTNYIDTCTNDGVSYPCEKTICDKVSRGFEEVCWYAGKETWHGCMGSRKKPWDERVHNLSKKIPGMINVDCRNTITRLTDDKDKVLDAIDDLSAGYETYIAPGVLWGWMSLTHNYPLNDGSNPETSETEVKKVIVLMTDGANTKASHPTNGTHASADRSRADETTEEVCEGARDDGVTVYTIAFDVDDMAAKSLMEECASAPTHFFDAEDATELQVAFQNITDALVDLHLVR